MIGAEEAESASNASFLYVEDAVAVYSFTLFAKTDV